MKSIPHAGSGGGVTLSVRIRGCSIGGRFSVSVEKKRLAHNYIGGSKPLKERMQ